MGGTMTPDDKICYCYNVSRRKLENFAARIRPVRPSQMSDCLGAGTGCGWCIPFLKQTLTPEEYAERRQNYIKTKQPRNQF
jgi:bacterioferritin-associated ferredoxin